MSCVINSGISASCRDNQGGIQEVYLANWIGNDLTYTLGGTQSFYFRSIRQNSFVYSKFFNLSPIGTPDIRVGDRVQVQVTVPPLPIDPEYIYYTTIATVLMVDPLGTSIALDIPYNALLTDSIEGTITVSRAGISQTFTFTNIIPANITPDTNTVFSYDDNVEFPFIEVGDMVQVTVINDQPLNPFSVEWVHYYSRMATVVSIHPDGNSSMVLDIPYNTSPNYPHAMPGTITIVKGVENEIVKFSPTGSYFYQITQPEETGSWVSNIITSVENSTTYCENIVDVNLYKLAPDLLAYIQTLSVGRWTLMVKDNMGRYYLIGNQFGNVAKISSLGAGKLYSDLNGCKISFTSREIRVPYPVNITAALRVIFS